MCYDIGGYDMIYSELKEMCLKAWIDNINCLCIDKTKNKNEGKYRIFNENKNTYIGRIPESEPF